MLKHLYIRNYTLIDTLDIEFQDGFSVITGETGAGKSIILGAIGLLLGSRADSKDIKSGCNKCLIEARFGLPDESMRPYFESNDVDFDDEECIIRREITAAGKSRAFVNDTPVSLAFLKELGERLVDIHSQHQNLLLNKHDFQLNVVDTIADDSTLLANYQKEYAAMQDLQEQYEQLKAEIEESQRNADFISYQHHELDEAHLQADEQEELEQRSMTMSHAEDIKSALFTASNALGAESTGIVEQLKSAIQALNSIHDVLPQAAELSQRMDTAYIELKDISQETDTLMDHIEFDPKELDSINERLDLIYALEKKYHCADIDELLALQEKLRQQLAAIQGGDESLQEIQEQLTKQTGKCQKLASQLTTVRSKHAKLIEKQLCDLLIPLGMPHVRFQIVMESQPLYAYGQDKIAFLFSANTSTPLQPISQVASGGEIARVMLALKAMVSGTVKLPTIIFDEIDTGVSGKIAEQMAHMMRQMGEENRQVISITHLPQIAASGQSHYKVFKEETAEGTASRMQQLTADERIVEIAQMLSGSDITEAAINNAKALLHL